MNRDRAPGPEEEAGKITVGRRTDLIAEENRARLERLALDLNREGLTGNLDVLLAYPYFLSDLTIQYLEVNGIRYVDEPEDQESYQGLYEIISDIARSELVTYTRTHIEPFVGESLTNLMHSNRENLDDRGIGEDMFRAFLIDTVVSDRVSQLWTTVYSDTFTRLAKDADHSSALIPEASRDILLASMSDNIDQFWSEFGPGEDGENALPNLFEVPELLEKRDEDPVIDALLGGIAMRQVAITELNDEMGTLVREARSHDVSWQKIADAAGMNRSGAYKRWDTQGREANRQSSRDYMKRIRGEAHDESEDDT